MTKQFPRGGLAGLAPIFLFIAGLAVGASTQGQEAIDAHGRILGVTAAATSELASHQRMAAHAVDGSFDMEDRPTSTGSVWESAGIGFNPGGPDDRAPAIQFDLGGHRLVSKIRIWNFPEPPVAVKRFALETSNDGADYTQVEIVDNLAVSGETVVPVGIPFARHIRFRILNNHGGTAYPVLDGDPVTGFMAFAGLLEVAFYGAEVEARSPEITREPEPRTIEAGATATFSVEATGIPTPTYQWRRDGEDLEDGALYVGTRGPNLTVRGPQPSDSGLFDVVVSNLAGSTPSAKALLTVNPPQEPPQITAHPKPVAAVEGSTVEFTGSASGVPTPELKWQVSPDGGGTWAFLGAGAGVSGVDSGTLTIANVSLEMNGTRFRLLAVNAAGEVASDGATLEVTPATSEITGHLVWYRADSAQFAGLEDGQPIANWLPEAGSSANPETTQIPGGEIVYRKSVPGLNGQPALEFSGGLSVVRNIANVDFDGVTMFLVFKNIGTGGAQRAVASENSNTLLGPWHPSAGGNYVPAIHFDGAWVAQPQEISGWVDPVGCVLGVALDAASTEKTFINGAPIAHPGGPRPLPTSRVGMLAFNGAVGPYIEPYRGHIAEFVVFKKVLSDAEIANVHEYLLGKYGLGGGEIPLKIEAHPQDQTVAEGTRAAFVAEVGGFPPPALQWQSSPDLGASWSDLEPGGGFDGVNSKVLTIPSATLAMNGRQFRLRAVSRVGAVESGAATLVVNPPVVEPIRIADVLASATSELTSHNRLAAHAVNGVYCDHSFFETAGVGFTPGGPDDRDPAITFDLRSPVALSQFIIWNSHERDPAIKRMLVEVSLDGQQFTSIGEKMLQPGGGCPPTPQTVDMGGVVARFVRFDFLENWNGVLFPVVGPPSGWPFIAIDEVEFYGRPGLAIHPQPPDLRVFEGSEAVLTVGLSSGADAQFQWWRDGERLADGAGVSGAASATLRLRGVAPADAGRFQAVAMVDSISLTSRVATLAVRMTPPMNQRTNFSVLHVFDDSFFKESNKPGKVGSGLIEGSDGFLYGTTRHGGTNLVDSHGPARGVGTLYRIRKNGDDFAILHHFGGDNSGSYSSIWTEPIEASDGLLYGVTYAGGVAGVGYIYKIHRDGAGFAILHHFQDGSVAGDAARSTAPLVEGPDGMLYGMTQYGGVKPSWTDWGQGAAFRIAKDGSTYEVLHSFGATPQSPTQPTGLSLGRDGRLYGTTARGGALGAGTLFRMNFDGGDLVVLAELGNWSSRPDFLPGNPLHASDGLLYGMSQSHGHLYRLQPSDGGFSILTPIVSDGSGGEPRPALIETRGGHLATPVISHGAHNAGSVVALSKDGSEFATLHSFNPALEPGGFPSSRLLEASDGALYGVTGMVDKTPENGGHAMIYRLAWNDRPHIVIQTPTPAAGGGWSIPFTTTETGGHTLWRAASPAGPWEPAGSLFLRAASGAFPLADLAGEAACFKVSRD